MISITGTRSACCAVRTPNVNTLTACFNTFNTTIIGHPYLYLPVCHSTNDYLLELSEKDRLKEGAVVLTDKQTAGRGQRGNSWEAQAGENFTFSILLKPIFLSPDNQFVLNISISLAIWNFLRDLLQEGVFIKWPNDLLNHGGR